VPRDDFKRRRCVVPADGFYEWAKVGAEKQPHRIGMADDTVFALAGLWERWKDPSSGETIRSFTIITTTPNELCAPIHNRMPVILPPSRYRVWLGEEPAHADELAAMPQPYPSKLMRAYRIGPAIGNVKDEGAEADRAARGLTSAKGSTVECVVLARPVRRRLKCRPAAAR
jgi:putative SOS response-associated peptidase YedK